MNEHFVNVKVDREERPDVDAVYMAATTALTGQGGWPMTCLLTPEGKPFYAGTFFPRAQFLALLRAVDEAWRERRGEVLQSSVHISSALASADASAAVSGPVPEPGHLDAAREGLAKQFDATFGGFGAAPKFPPSMALEFLLRNFERTGEPDALAMAERTLEAMARGGIYDQLAGGFARYSVDARWIVPHFEKMLYDNALLLRVYLHWWRLRHDRLAERVARETADFLLSELQTAEGGFASALDADTEGIEGLTYVWTPAQLEAVVGDEAGMAADVFAVTDAGTFEHGASTLQLPVDPADAEWYERVRTELRTAREDRAQPHRDDKVVTAWNGLAIAALAEAGVLLDRRYLAAAERCAHLLLDVHLIDGRLRRTSRNGVAGHAVGVAEDYGDLADGLLVLHQATGETRWLVVAGELLAVALARFADGNGGFFDTADDAETLVQRPRDPTDNAAPSGSSALANALLEYSALTGSPDHRAAAENALGVVAALGERAPRFIGWALAAAEGLVAGPIQIALVGGDEELEQVAWMHRPPGAVVVSGRPDQPGVPLLAGRPLVNGGPAGYVCRGMVCDLPVTTSDELVAQLARPIGPPQH
jgi:uncharacterized protein YyaL (SSP411 family)